MLDKLFTVVLIVGIGVMVALRVGEYELASGVVGSVQQQIDSGKAEVSVGASKPEIGSLTADRDGLKRQLFECQKRATTANKLLADSRAECASLLKQAHDAEAKIAVLNKSVDNLAKMNSSMVDRRDEQNKKIAALQHTIDTFTCPLPDHTACNKKIAELEKQLASKGVVDGKPIMTAEQQQQLMDELKRVGKEHAALDLRAKFLEAELKDRESDLKKSNADKPAASPAPSPKARDNHIVDWQNSTAEAESLAEKLGRPVFIAFATDPCPFCDDVRRDVYNTDQVGQVLCREYVPVWIVAQHGNLDAADYKVSRFPTAVISRGNGYVKFRPAMSPEAFLKQLGTEKGKL